MVAPHVRSLVVAVVVAAVGRSPVATAQQAPAARPDTTLRADYHSLKELLDSLPVVAPPAFDEARALWLGALPMACMDRLQTRPGGRAGGRGAATADSTPQRATGAGAGAGRGNAPVDSSSAARGRGAGAAAVASPGDSAARGRGAGAAATGGGGGGGGGGAGYFWTTTYSLVPDHDRLRAFWGCNDFHSAVSSTWALARVLRLFPHGPLSQLAREKLNAHLGKSNLEGEIEFFRAAAAAINPIPSANQTGLFERPNGFAWVLELQSELRTWPDTQAQRWAANMAPLAAWIADGLATYYDKLVDPVRGGAQTNTAQSMTLAFDYADAAADLKLRRALVANARRFYLADTMCATQSERVPPFGGGGGGGAGGAGGGRGAAPAGRAAGGGGAAGAGGAGAGRAGGRGAAVDSTGRSGPLPPNDLTGSARGGRGAATGAPTGGGTAAGAVLSPCLTEAALMSRVLPPTAYVAWLARFLPPLQSGRFAPLTVAIEIPVAAPAPVLPVAAASGRAGSAPDSAAPASNAGLAAERARRAELSFTRAQAMERIARALPAGDGRTGAWHRLSAIQADRGFALMRDDATATAWLPAQALLYGAGRPTGPVATATSLPGPAKRAASSDSTKRAAGFKDLASFYASLPRVDARPFDMALAMQLSTMPLACLDHPAPHPNGVPYLWQPAFTPVPDFETTRVFYGCYDWHSAVNSAWTLVRILKMFPDLPSAPAIRQKLGDHFAASNVAGDLAFMRGAGTFEVPYGYAWLLRLQYELRSWKDPEAQRWATNMQPMATFMSERLTAYFKGLMQPVRTGVHPNTAMAMDNALDYARAFDPALEQEIRASAERLFRRDIHCNTAAEPGASDFASPCLMEASIMGQLMDRAAFVPWLDEFLPALQSDAFHPLTQPLGPEFVRNPTAIASKSHIVGLAFVRATSMGELANALPPDDPRAPVLRRLAAIQAANGFPLMGAVGYDGSHYYASWATTYLITTPAGQRR